METPDKQESFNIATAVANLHRSLEEKFILVGGAALVCQGSTRITKDVDLLLPSAPISHPAFTLDHPPEVTRRDGVIYTKAGETEFPVDILRSVIGDKTYEDLEPFTTTILDGVKALDLPIALGIKIRCWYMRGDDDHGLRKQRSDLEDIAFISRRMRETGKVVDNVVAKAIPVGCYSMQLVKYSLEVAGCLDQFLVVGGDRFQVSWEDDSEDQREWYTLLIADQEEIADTD